MASFKSLKRHSSMFRSAELSAQEVLLFFANRLIYFFSRLYYRLKFFFGPRGVKFPNYRRHLPKGIKPIGYCLLASQSVDVIYKEYFIGRLKFYFSNNGAPLAIMHAINELGYVVDIIDYKDVDFVPKRHYDVFFFHHYKVYDLLRPRLNPDVVSIGFESTAYWKPMLENIRRRLAYFKQRHNLELPESEFNHFLWMEQQKDLVERVSRQADGHVVIGDQLAKSFEQLNNSQVKLVKNGVIPDAGVQKDTSLSNLDRGRKKFLFFGGGTDVIRKGLDIVLDAFIGSPYELYICMDLPPKFEQIFDISAQKNIHHFNYLKLGSKKFMRVANECDFVIQPSAAEGVPGGVLETMKYGLIPIVSKECNIPEAAEIGYLLPEVTVEAVKQAMDYMAALPAEILQQKAQETVKTIADMYSPRAFTNDVKTAITDIVKNKSNYNNNNNRHG